MIATPDKIQRIDEAGLAILERAGVLLGDQEMRETLASQGCKVEGQRVWLPREFVERVLEQVPSTFVVYSRDGTHSVQIGGEARTATNSGVMPRIYDLETEELRLATLKDVRDSTRILDALSHVGIVCATLVEPTDVPPALSIVQGFEATLRSTTKPIIGPGPTNEGEARWTVTLGQVIRGGQAALAAQPFFIPWLALPSPLTYHASLVSAIRICAKAGLPLAFVTNPMTALTAPVTLAGALAQMHAELLGAIVFAQQVRPGTPVVYQGSATIADLHSLIAVKGRPETSLTLQAAVLLGRYRQLPTTSFGLNNTSKMADVAYGYEKAVNALTCMLARPNILSGMGMLGNGVYAGHESLIIDHEIVGMLWRLTEGIRVDEHTLDLKVIREAMEGADFITHEHTLAHLRSGEYWRPTLSDNLGLDEWLAQGKPGALSRARDKARDILSSHQVDPLPLEIDTRLQATIAEAQRELVSS